MAKSPDERIAALREKIAKKQATIEGYNVTLANTQKNISALEADMLAKTLHKKGINISEVAAAIEAGLFDRSVPEKPPDKAETEPKTTDKDGAICSTEDSIEDKEDLNE